MSKFITHLNTIRILMNQNLPKLGFIPLLALRLYLAPIFIMAGYQKMVNFENMVAWFGNTEWGLGLPFAPLMVALTILAELGGGIALLLGVFVRGFSFMLMITMIVAALKVHLKNGWHAIAPTDASISIANLFSFSSAGQASLQNSVEAGERLERARAILQEHGNYDWLTETGNFVILNNGIEFSATYTLMLLVLICYGAGRYLSVDYYVANALNKFTLKKPN